MYTYTYIQIHTCVHISTYLQFYIHTYSYTYVQTYVQTYTHTYIHTYSARPLSSADELAMLEKKKAERLKSELDALKRKVNHARKFVMSRRDDCVYVDD